MRISTITKTLLAFMSLGIVSCSESYLDVESKTESNTSNFYKTQNDAYRALIGCYDGWRQTSSNPGFAFYVASEVMGAECFGATGNTDGRGYQVVDRFDIAQSSSDLNLYEADWARYYQGIYRCNELIKYEPQIEWKNETLKGTYMGECHALRAILYFDLVRMFGNIPLLTVATEENVPQADPAEVYQVIFDDLQFAIDNIPADAYPKSDTANNDGHITKYAAEALYARAYLYYTGYYGASIDGVTKDKALDYCEDVISSGEYDLVAEYKNLWPAASAGIAEVGDAVTLLGTYAGDGNCETVLAMKFTNTQDYNGNNDSNRWQVMLGMRNLPVAPYGRGWGALTVNPQFVNQYEAGDTRKKASIIDIVNEGIVNADGFEASYKDQREYTGYVIKKYSPLCFADGTSAVKIDGSGGFQEQNHQDWIIMRYADVLLMAAEAILQSGGNVSEALSYVNQVRSRVNLPALTNLTLDDIKKERRMELAFEFVRYQDLLRWGDAATVLANQGKKVSLGTFENGVEQFLSPDNAGFKSYNSYLPYPETELTVNNLITQHEGY